MSDNPHSRFVDPDKLAKLTTKQANLDAKKIIQWPTPGNMVSMVKHIKGNKTGLLHLTLSKPSKHVAEFYVIRDPFDKNHVLIKPVSGFVPCGWFTLRWLEEQLEVAGILLSEKDNDDQP